MYGTLLSGQAVEVTVIKAHRMTLPWCRLIAIVLGDWAGLDWTGLDWTGLDWAGLGWTGLGLGLGFDSGRWFLVSGC